MEQNTAPRITDDTLVVEEVMTAEDFIQRLDEIHELPTLSTVAMKLSKLLMDINISAKDVAEVIQYDQAIVTKLLKMVNSAFFGFSNKVSSVQHALMLLGFNTVRNAIIAIDVINALKPKNKIKGFDISAFWQHAIGVAVISRHLDEETGHHFREDVFTAGIIHDIGKIVMAHYFECRYQAALETMYREKINYRDAENRHFPMNHADVGMQLARRWHLPETMCNVIGRHHATSKNSSVDALVHIVHASDALFHVYLEDHSPTEDWPIGSGARQLLKPQIKSAGLWIPALRQEIKEAYQLLLGE
jgi:putative nucleotidyltransferase with HDIG domain